MKEIIKKIVPAKTWSAWRDLKLSLLDGYAIKSYSQEGEELILRKIFDKKDRGFYVDVGAHHPQRFSNTYFFYKKGWSGINIDAMPGSMELFKKNRSRDLNIEVAIAKEPKEMTFYIFNESALNTLDENLARQRVNDTYYIVKEVKIITRTLKEILRQYLPEERKIDFMSIDVEGLDLEVLESNDWQLFRPKCLLVESLGTTLNEITKNSIYQFISAQNYELFAKTFRTLIFVDGSQTL